MPTPEIQKFLIANALMGTSERYRTLDRLEAYYRDFQDDFKTQDWHGRPMPSSGWRDPQPVTEMWAPSGYNIIDRRGRRPHVRYNVAKRIVDTYSSLLFAEGRFPEITYEGDPATNEILRDALLSSAFESAMIHSRGFGGSQGTALITYRFVDGKLEFEVHNPKNAEVLEWENKAQFRPKLVRIQYVYPSDEPDGAPEMKQTFDAEKKETRLERVWRWYRRDLSDTADTLYDNPELESDKVPQFVVKQEVLNTLGKFRGVWIQNRPCDYSPDGLSDYEDLLDLFDATNAMASQLDRALQYQGDPALVLKVKEGHEVGTIKRGPENAIILEPDEDMEYVEITGATIGEMRVQVKEYINAALDGAGIIPRDPKEISGSALSAKALEYLWQPTLAEAGKYRQQYGTKGMVPLLELVVEDMKKLPTLGLEVKHKGKAGPEAKAGTVALKWGRYFQPTPEDVRQEIENASSAELAGYISQDTAIAHVAPMFGVQDVEAERTNIGKLDPADRERRLADAAARRTGASTGTEEGAQGDTPAGAPRRDPRFRGTQ